MHFYIDESGVFTNPSNKQFNPSCVGILGIPSTVKKEVFKKFKLLTHNWSPVGEELKGKNLNESQVAAVVNLLKRYDVILEISVIDLGIHSVQEIEIFKQLQGERFIEAIKPTHNSLVIKQLTEMKTIFTEMSNQLFVQAFILMHQIPRALYHSILYYARRIPQELQRFYWVIDAKDKSITEYEKAWSLAIYPAMAGESFKNPIKLVEGGDYSYWSKFQSKDKNYLKSVEKEGGFGEGEIDAIKLDQIFKNFRFQDSEVNIGLQIIDILVNATRRALTGKLKKSGWEDIGSLMILRKPNTLQSIRFNTDKKQNRGTTITKVPYYEVFDQFHKKAKSMWRDDEV